MRDKFKMVAKTLYGLEDLLAEELAEIGAENINVLNRSVEFEGDLVTLYKANLLLRLAGRILKSVYAFKSNDKNRFYHELYNLDWSQHMTLKQTFSIDAVVHNSHFDNSLYAAQLTKDAICDQFRKKTGKRPSVDKDNPDIRINLYMNANNVTVALDSSNIPLHKRGYRTSGGTAPLNEILAAGIMKLTGYDGSSALFDPMCGSGTLSIEAALIARNIAPGLLRNYFGFQKWNDYNPKLFRKLTDEAMARIKEPLEQKISASDKNEAVVKEARANINRAGLTDDIRVARCPFEKLNHEYDQGILIMNPPYGERLAVAEINKLYKDIGDRLKQSFNGFDAYIFTGNLDASKYIGLKTSRRIKLYNGQLECRLLKYEIYQGSRKRKFNNITDDNSANVK